MATNVPTFVDLSLFAAVVVAVVVIIVFFQFSESKQPVYSND